MIPRLGRPAGRASLAAPLLACLAALLGGCAELPVAPTPLDQAPTAQDARASAPAGAPAGAASAAAATTRPKATPEAAAQARAAFAEGVRLEGAGDLGGAAAAFDRAAGLDPDLPWAALDAGVLRERLGDDRRAAAAYERALQDQPGFAPAGQSLARLRLRQGRAKEAAAWFRERLAAVDGTGYRVGLAEALLATGDLAGAEAECRTALKADEKSVPAMVVLATTYSARKRHELARMVLENARQLDPADPAVWNRLGLVELALGDRPQALEHLRAAAALRPDYPEAHANYGAMLAEADDFAAAAQELELSVKHGPRAPGAWLVLGNAYRGLQRFEQAEQAYRKALALDPALADVHFNLAVLYLDVEKPGLPLLKRLEQGLDHFDAFEKAGGSDPRVAAYRKDAARDLDRERKRLAREEKDRARKELEAKRKAEEAARPPPAAPAAEAPPPPAPPSASSDPAAEPTAPAAKASAPAAKGAAAKTKAKAPAPAPGAKAAPPKAQPPGAKAASAPAPSAPAAKLGEPGGDK